MPVDPGHIGPWRARNAGGASTQPGGARRFTPPEVLGGGDGPELTIDLRAFLQRGARVAVVVTWPASDRDG